MIRHELPAWPGLTLYGVVRGLVREADQLGAALDAGAPTAIGLGLAVEESRSLTDHFVGRRTEPFVPLLASETVEIRELGQFGEVRVPHPAFLAALEWAERRGVPVRPIDPNEDAYARLFGDSIGYLELVRRTVRERRLLRAPPRANDADGFVVGWSATVNRGAQSRALQLQRERFVADELRRMLGGRARVVAVVDRERIDPLLAALQDGDRASAGR